MEKATQKSSQATREKIFKTATKLFAQKGYSGTRVKEIAEDIGISQALIYYNFKSKEQILDEILEEFKEKTVEMFTDVFDTNLNQKNKPVKWLPEEMEKGLDFFSKNREITTILIFESLKKDSNTESLIDFFNHINNKVRFELLNKRGFKINENDINNSIVDFFYIFIPVIFFSILEEQWSEYYDVDKKLASNEFSEILNNIFKKFYL